MFIKDFTMESEIKKYSKYRRDVIFLLLCTGSWPKYDKYPYVLKMFLFVSSLVVGILTCCGILAFCVKNITNITLVTKSLGLVLSFSIIPIKAMFLRLHQNDMLALNEGLTTYFERDLKIPEFRPHLLAHYKTFSKLFYFLNYTVFLNAIFHATVPLSLVKSGKYVRTFPLLVPFSYEPGGLIHWLIYVFELFAGYFIWCVTTAADSIFGLYCLQIVGQLRLLSYKLQNLKLNKNYKEELKFCVDRHNQLMEAKQLMERSFGFITIYVSITCAIILCTLIYQATQMKSISFLKVCYLICYVTLKLIQVFSYALGGNIINNESQNCLHSVYNACWTDSLNVEFMNDLLIILSQKSLNFKAKGILILDFDLFSKVVNTSVSYFFLLRTLEETFDE